MSEPPAGPHAGGPATPTGAPTEVERRAISRRRAREVALVLALLVVGGIVIAVTGASVAGVAVGSGIMGVGGVAAVSAVFYEIGAGEDRERAAAARRGAGSRRRDEPRPPG